MPRISGSYSDIKRLILEQREEYHELQRYVEDELSYREAGLGTRVNGGSSEKEKINLK
ncbi:hypothetical protein HAPAU_32550 [Halalkalicoccus paucihalophilus]|uniref:Uncharacterized protein n=1 Tax=Halalkalicoccus paucihalophilus TaxID=1008153 RepID=A0A151A9V1_9EURY|nr:hypothetical protein HAPAU_32550 [Halalkalicoccus paucihalophilus]